MKNIVLSISALAVACFFSCNESGNSKEMEVSLNETIEEVAGKSADEWVGKLDQLFTLDMASKLVGYPSGEAVKDYNQVLKSAETHSVAYKWDKGRVETNKKFLNPITGKPMEIPTSDYIEISWVRNTTLEKFKFNYHTPTAEELNNANQAIEGKLKEMENEGRVSSDQADLAKEMATGLADGLSFDEVPGVGDYAVWNNKDKNLKVFYKGLEFQMYANLGDEARNKQSCIEAAKMIIQEKL